MIFMYYMKELNDSNIRDAVDLWFSDIKKSNRLYGIISKWNVSKVTNMDKLFALQYNDKFQDYYKKYLLFNEDISNWNVSNVTSMYRMFWESNEFNQDLSNWNVSKVLNMDNMFYGAKKFNKNINNWDVSNVTNMSGMFYNTIEFNQDLSNWNVSKVYNMQYMFYDAITFNQNISNWNVSKVDNMQYMFCNAIKFNQNISNWNIAEYTRVNNMFCFNTMIPFYKLKTTSFFDEPYKSMELLKRKQIFDKLFKWDKMKNFIIFLTNYNYILIKNKNVKK